MDIALFFLGTFLLFDSLCIIGALFWVYSDWASINSLRKAIPPILLFLVGALNLILYFEETRSYFREYIASGNENSSVRIPNWEFKKIQWNSWYITENGKFAVFDLYNGSNDWIISSVKVELKTNSWDDGPRQFRTFVYTSYPNDGYSQRTKASPNSNFIAYARIGSWSKDKDVQSARIIDAYGYKE